MMFVKVFCGEEVIDLNISLILKVQGKLQDKATKIYPQKCEVELHYG
jgi:hypothetical protein